MRSAAVWFGSSSRSSPAAYSSSTLLFAAMACSAGALLAASHLNRWYIRTLENSLLYQGSDLDLSDTKDGSTTRVLFDLRQRRADQVADRRAHDGRGDEGGSRSQPAAAPVDPLVQDIMALRDGTTQEIMHRCSPGPTAWRDRWCRT